MCVFIAITQAFGFKSLISAVRHPQVDRYSAPRSKPKKAGATAAGQGKPGKKAKDKQSAGQRGSKKTTSENQSENRPAVGDKEKSKEMNNKLAEAKE